MLRSVLAVVLGLGVTVAAYIGAGRVEASVQDRVFDEQVERAGVVARTRMESFLDPVQVFGLTVERQVVNFGTFMPELQSLQANHDAIRAMAWLPVVKDRPMFEEQVNRYYQGFEIREQTPEGDVQTAGPATAWVPILLILPEHENDVLRGLDIGNQPDLANTMQLTYRRHAPVVAPPFKFTGIEQPLMLSLQYVPEPEGFGAALIDPKTALEVALEGRSPGLVARWTDDVTSTVLYEEPGFAAEGARTFAASFGARTFSIEITRGPEYQPTVMNLPMAAGLAGAGVTVLMLGLTLLGGRTES